MCSPAPETTPLLSVGSAHVADPFRTPLEEHRLWSEVALIVETYVLIKIMVEMGSNATEVISYFHVGINT